MASVAPISPTWSPEIASRCARPASANVERSEPGRSSRSARISARPTALASGGRRRRRRFEARARAPCRARATGPSPREIDVLAARPASTTRPTTIPVRPGRRGHGDGRPIRTHSPRTLSASPAARMLGIESVRTTRRPTKQLRLSLTVVTVAPTSVRRAGPPGADISLTRPSTTSGSPVPSSCAQEDVVRAEAAEPSSNPAAITGAHIRKTEVRLRSSAHAREAPRRSGSAATPGRTDDSRPVTPPAIARGNRRPREIPTARQTARRARGGTRRGLAPEPRLRAPRASRPGRHGSAATSAASGGPPAGPPE